MENDNNHINEKVRFQSPHHAEIEPPFQPFFSSPMPPSTQWSKRMTSGVSRVRRGTRMRMSRADRTLKYQAIMRKVPIRKGDLKRLYIVVFLNV